MKSKRVALYIRVSTEEQARQGLSLDAQLTDLRSYADKHKYNIVGVYT
ncbi:MAG: recombinase family protein, partial [Megasphaera micronuciformis]|nr:recombinase family protein [Megasphaera micronuciformis]